MIEIKNLKKEYADVTPLNDINVTINDGDVISIIGPSGTGKSTFIRCINLLEKPTSGHIIFNGEDITEKGVDIKKIRQKMGMVFQSFNLFNHLTVIENLMIPMMDLMKTTKQEAYDKGVELLKQVGMADKMLSYPDELSGGQKQRVAIARALANNPDILLCDEATSALDPTTTRSILALLKKLNKELGLTIVIITHQMEVIKDVCNKVAVMENGRIVEQGDVFDIFAAPEDEVTKRFIRSTSNLTKIEQLIAEDSPVVKLAADETLVRFTFIEKNVSEPIISAISRLYEITINIIFADVEIVQGAPIGGTVAIVSGKEDVVKRALAHIEQQGVGVETLKQGKEA